MSAADAHMVQLKQALKHLEGDQADQTAVRDTVILLLRIAIAERSANGDPSEGTHPAGWASPTSQERTTLLTLNPSGRVHYEVAFEEAVREKLPDVTFCWDDAAVHLQIDRRRFGQLTADTWKTTAVRLLITGDFGGSVRDAVDALAP